MVTKSLKGFRAVQEMKDGKLVVSVERVPFYGRDASARIRQKKSKKQSVKHSGVAALFERKG